MREALDTGKIQFLNSLLEKNKTRGYIVYQNGGNQPMAAEDNGVINRCVNLFLKVRIGFNELRQTGQHSPLPQTTFPGSFPHASQVLYQILQLEQAQDFWAQDFRTHQWPCHWPTRGSLVDSQGSRGQAASQDPGKLLWPRSLHLRRKGNVAVSWHHMCSLLLHF